MSNDRHGGSRRSRATGFRWLGVALAGVFAVSGAGLVLADAPAGAATATMSVSPDTNLTNGQSVTVSGSGITGGGLGAIVQCSSADNQPTITVEGNAVPVSCSNPLNAIESVPSSGNFSAQFTVHTGVVGPPGSGTDSAGNSAATDAAKYPCPPTPAQEADGVVCQVNFGLESGLQLTSSVYTALTMASSLANGTVGTAYSQSLSIAGGAYPYTTTVTSGAPPPGLTISSGALSGTPSSAGTYGFTVKATDAQSETKSVPYSVTIAPPAALAVTTTSLPSEFSGASYSQTLAASGGESPYTWTVSSGSLPTGLTLSSGGLISGSSTAMGTADFTVQVTDSESPQKTATKALSIDVLPPEPTVTMTVTPASPDLTGASPEVSVTVAPPGGSGPVPTGTVTIMNGTAATNCETINLYSFGNGTGSCTLSGLAKGSYDLKAEYSGDSTYEAASSAAQAYAVGAHAQMQVQPTPYSIALDKSLPVTVTFSPPAGDPAPTGQVSVMKGSTTLCSAAKPRAAKTGGYEAKCTVPATSLTLGANALTVTYAGDTAYFAATSQTRTVFVKATPTVTFSASPASGAKAGSNLTLKATVTGPSGDPAPTGTVNFKAGKVAATVCKAAPVTKGVATCTVKATYFAHPVMWAAYQGNPDYFLTSSKKVNVPVKK